MMVIGAVGALTVNSWTLLNKQASVRGGLRAPAANSEDTLLFSQLNAISSMNEIFPLEDAQAAYNRVIRGKARFRVVLKINSSKFRIGRSLTNPRRALLKRQGRNRRHRETTSTSTGALLSLRRTCRGAAWLFSVRGDGLLSQRPVFGFKALVFGFELSEPHTGLRKGGLKSVSVKRGRAGAYTRTFPAVNFRKAVEPVLQACDDHW